MPYNESIEKKTSFHLIYNMIFSLFWLVSYEGESVTVPAPVLFILNPLDPTDLPSSMQYFPRISPNSLKISPRFRADI